MSKTVTLTGEVEKTLEAFRKTKEFLSTLGYDTGQIAYDIYEDGRKPTLTLHCVATNK